MTAHASLARVARLSLAHLPTRIERFAALDELVGTELWIKRDDTTAGAEAGNKIRKLEYLLAEALEQRARAVITCGGLQSNHARATALLARRLGLQPVLLLRTDAAPKTREGNLLLDDLAGAQIKFINKAEYAQRDELMRELAEVHAHQGRSSYVIPEGGSNGLGALGYYAAMREVREQLDAGAGSLPERFDAIVHACGSGGTAAGVALGAGQFQVAEEVLAFAVCDDRAYFEQRIALILAEAKNYLTAAPALAPLRIEDAYRGPAYGVPSPEQLTFIRKVARVSGLVLDPVYSGKALYGLAQLPTKPRRTLFIHTGGLPGLLADHARFATPES
jgi:D-cysteine desulfhydrase